MAFADMDPRETAEAQVKAATPDPAPLTPAEPVVPSPSLLDAQRRQAARVREATVARWLRRLST